MALENLFDERVQQLAPPGTPEPVNPPTQQPVATPQPAAPAQAPVAPQPAVTSGQPQPATRPETQMPAATQFGLENAFDKRLQEIQIKTPVPGISVDEPHAPGFEPTPFMVENVQLLTNVAASVTTGDPAPLMEYWDRYLKTAEGRARELQFGLQQTVKEGWYQLGYDMMAQMTGDPAWEAAANDFTAMTTEQRKQFEESFNEEFGDHMQFGFYEHAGRIIPYLGFAKTAIPAEAGFWSTVALGGLESAAIGAFGFASEFDDTYDFKQRMENRKSMAKWGSLIGGGPGTVLTLWPAFLNSLRTTMLNMVKSGSLDFAQHLERVTGIPLKLSQATPHPVAKQAEQTVAGSTSGKAKIQAIEKEQRVASLNFWQKLMHKFEEPGALSFNARVVKTYDKAVKDIRDVRRAHGEANFRKAQVAAAKSVQRPGVPAALAGQPRVIPANNMLNELDKQIQRIELSTSPNKNVLNQLYKIRDKLIDRGRHYSPVEFQADLEVWGATLSGKADALKNVTPGTQGAIGKNLYRALRQDLDDAIKAKVPGSKELKFARDQYATDSIPLTELQSAGLGKLFGGDVPKSEEAIIKKFMKMESSQLKNVMRIMDDADPGFSNSLRTEYLQEVLTEATMMSKGGQAGLSILDQPFDYTRILKMGDDQVKLAAVFEGSGEMMLIREGLEVTSMLTRSLSQASGNFLQTMATRAAGVVASRDKTFIARLAAELLTPKILARVLRNEKAVRILQKAVKTQNAGVWATALLQVGEAINFNPRPEPPPEEKPPGAPTFLKQSELDKMQ